MHYVLQKLLQRPLCLVVVSYAIVSFLVQIFMAPPREGAALSNNPATEYLSEGARMSLTGQLYKKETKNDHLIYYLNDIQIIENSNQNSNVNKNKYNFNEEGSAKAVCYMSNDDGSDAPIGRWLHVQGKMLPFEAAENEGQFDAQSYYAGMGIFLRLWDTRIVMQGNSYDMFGDGLVNIKSSIEMKYYKYMSAENAGVLCAMLLGDKTSMDSEVKNLYRKNGIAHVLAISGLHISLLGMLLYRFLRRMYLPPPLCCMLGIFLVMVYIKLVGFGTSSFRAVCMFVIYMLADLLGRTYDLLTALAFSALLLLIDNPAAMFEAGFLLSYFAVLGLAVVLPVFQSFFSQKFRQGLLPGFSVQVLIFPITLWFYYEFPVYSFLLNFIVVPCMSVVLVSGIVGAFPGFGFVLYLTDFLLTFYEWLCRRAESLPGAVIVTGRPKVWQMVLYYGLIAAWLLVFTIRRDAKLQDVHDADGDREGKQGRCARMRRMVPALFPLVCMLLFLLPVHREDRLDMLSVGQGDCLIMRDSTGSVVMVDGGSTDVSEAGKYRLLPFLKYHGISEVDAVFLSHAHADHYSAIIELLESAGKDGVRIKSLCLTGYAAGVSKPEVTESSSETRTYARLVSLAGRAGCEVVYINPGDRLSCGKMQFECIYPPADMETVDENDTSMVLLAKLSDFSVLFTGDITSACDGEVIRRLRELGVYEIDCLKVAHHGAQTSTSEELLETFDFNLALISCGAGNSYGHPHASLLGRLKNAGCETFVTTESGRVTVRIRKGSVRVSCYR